MIKLLRLCTLVLLLAMASQVCYAQFDFGGDDDSSVPAAPAWSSFHLNPSVRVKLDFRNASVDAVIQTLSQASGIAIVKDPALTGGITLQSPRPQSLDDAFAMFSAVLNLKNADLTKSGNFLLIKVRAQATNGRFGGNGGGGGYGGTTGTGGYGGRSSTQSQILQVYVLKYANATDLAKVINDVYATTSTGGNNNAASPFAGFGQAAAVTGGGFGGGFTGRRGGGGIGGVNGDNVHASADDFSNSLVINAPQRDQDEIADIISQIDKPATQPQSTQVFRLQYALATDLLSVVQNILTNTTSLGRGGTSPTTQASRNTNQGGGGFFGRFGGGGSSTSNSNVNGTVSADTRTNSLVVTTTDQLMQQITQVVVTLDKPATYESSTYLYVMKNARADVVANLLNESLGNRETNGPTGGSLTTTGATQPTVTAGTSTSSTVGSGSPTLGSSTSTNRNTSSNSQSVTSSNSSLETQGLDENNHIVNIRNLTGNVLLVPNVDTNSIIVVSPPEDWPIVKGILQQMDQIPQQVMIDVLVVEVSLDKTDQFGIEYSTPANHGEFSQVFGLQSTYNSVTGQGIYAPSATVANPLPGAVTGLVYTLTSGQYSAFLQAAATDTKIDVLSTPRIFTSNNATAQINVSQSVPYETGTTVTNGTVQNSFDFLDVGLVLTVTPRITESGYVTMDVSQTANSIAAFLDNGTEPEVNQREAETTVSVMDGRTVCLGGIIQDTVNSTVNKVPVLGDIPILGNLFKSSNKSNNKDELLVFLTPHVISTPEDAQTVKDETEAELGSEARGLIPKAPPAPKGDSPVSPLAPSTAPATQTTVTVTTPSTGSVMTTPPSELGPVTPTPPVTVAPSPVNPAPQAPADVAPPPAAGAAPATSPT